MFCCACIFSNQAHALVLPWLEDPLNSEERVAGFGKKSKPASCPPPPDTEQILKINEVVIAVICHNTQARSAYWTLLNSSDSYSSQVLAAYLPSISATLSRSKRTLFTESGKSSSISTSTSLDRASVTLYDLGQRELTLESAELGLIASGHSYDSTLQGFISDALQAYYGLLIAQNNIEIVKESLEFSQQSTEAARLRYELGLVPLADKLQSEVSLSQSKLALEQAEIALVQLQAALALLMGMSPDHRIIVAELDDSQLMEDPFTARVRSLMKYAKQERVDLKAARLGLKASEVGYEALKRENLLSVSVTATSGYDDIDVLNNSTTRGSTIGVNVTIPIFTAWQQTYNERTARRSLKAQREALKDTERNIEQNVWNAWHAYKTAKTSWEISWDQLGVATQLRDVSLGRYKEGLGTILDVLSAQNQYSSALQTHLQTRLDLLTARIDLISAVGVLNLDSMQTNVMIPVDESEETNTTQPQEPDNS